MEVFAGHGLVSFLDDALATSPAYDEAFRFISAATDRLVSTLLSVQQLLRQITAHVLDAHALFVHLGLASSPQLDDEFYARTRQSFGALVGHIQALSVLLTQTTEIPLSATR